MAKRSKDLKKWQQKLLHFIFRGEIFKKVGWSSKQNVSHGRANANDDCEIVSLEKDENFEQFKKVHRKTNEVKFQNY